jgi:hypothetical protein
LLTFERIISVLAKKGKSNGNIYQNGMEYSNNFRRWHLRQQTAASRVDKNVRQIRYGLFHVNRQRLAPSEPKQPGLSGFFLYSSGIIITMKNKKAIYAGEIRILIKKRLFHSLDFTFILSYLCRTSLWENLIAAQSLRQA